MNPIFYYDIASFIFLSIIIMFSLLAFKRKKKIDHAFFSILFSIFAYTIFSIVLNYSLMKKNISVSLVYSLKTIIALVFGFVSAGFMLYTYVDISRTTKLNKVHLLFVGLTLIWNVVWVIINDFTNICFEVTSSGFIYNKGYFLLFFSYICAMIYFPVMEVVYHKSLYGPSVRIALSYSFLSLGFAIFTIIYSSIKSKLIFMTSLFFTVQVLVAFIQMLVDKLNMDSNTSLYLEKQCLRDISHSNGSSIFMIEFLGYHQYSAESLDLLIKSFRRYLANSIDDFTMYRLSNYKIIVKSRKINDLNVLKNIENFSSNGIKIDEELLAIRIKTAALHKDSTICPNCAISLLNSMLNLIENGEQASIVLTKELREELESTNVKVKKIMNAVDNGGVVPFYQGIYSLDENKITICEALARLKINDELLSPGSFISILENNHCINKLDRNILIEVLKELKKQKDSNPDFKIQAISINLTAEDIINQEFVDYIKEMIRINEIDPQMICLEICETTIISNFEKVKLVMNDLNKLGIRFFLDDFGTGFSNIQAVLKLPFYLIKIDKSVLDATKENYKNIEVLNGVVKALNSVGVKTLVEGVENENDLNIVKNAGANYIQGFYFHKPSYMADLIS